MTQTLEFDCFHVQNLNKIKKKTINMGVTYWSQIYFIEYRWWFSLQFTFLKLKIRLILDSLTHSTLPLRFPFLLIIASENMEIIYSFTEGKVILLWNKMNNPQWGGVCFQINSSEDINIRGLRPCISNTSLEFIWQQTPPHCGLFIY